MSSGEEGSVGADGDGRARRVKVHDVARGAGRHAETATLPDREALHPLVRSEDRPADVHHRTRRAGVRAARKRVRCPRAMKAHVHALGLGRVRQPEVRWRSIGPRLGEVTDREQGTGGFALAQHVEDIGLVLRRVGAAPQPVDARGVALDSGVVSGGHPVEPERQGSVQGATELDRPVALDARVGCTRRCVRRNVGLDDRSPKSSLRLKT